MVEDHTIDGRESRQQELYTFKPSEFTGRSTSCVHQQQQQQPKVHNSIRPRDSISASVEEILATSCSADVRNRLSNLTNLKKLSQSTTISDNNSLPRTADITLESNEMHSNFSWDNIRQNNVYENENFTPAEQMKNQLLEDEKSWENEFALIPQQKQNQTFSGDANAQKNNGSAKIKNFIDYSNNNNNEENDNGDCEQFSIGQYFSTKCVEIRDMIPNPSPTKRIKPFALIDSIADSSGTYIYCFCF